MFQKCFQTWCIHVFKYGVNKSLGMIKTFYQYVNKQFQNVSTLGKYVFNTVETCLQIWFKYLIKHDVNIKMSLNLV